VIHNILYGGASINGGVGLGENCEFEQILYKRHQIGPYIPTGNHRQSNGIIFSDLEWSLTRVSLYTYKVRYLKNLSKSCLRDKLSYYRTLTGNHTQSIVWYHFQWPWVTSDLDFKVTIFFDIEYLRKGMT